MGVAGNFRGYARRRDRTSSFAWVGRGLTPITPYTPATHLTGMIGKVDRVGEGLDHRESDAENRKRVKYVCARWAGIAQRGPNTDTRRLCVS